jgi:gliding motility-associated-like protein
VKFLFTLVAGLLATFASSQCDSAIFIPEKFNWLAMTDSTRFKPGFAADQPDRYEFIIHNKWGETVFETTIPEQGWNGLRNNRTGNCEAGTFLWTLNCEWKSDSTSVFCMGYVTCLGSRGVKVTPLDTIQCKPSVYVPNAITPNGDGINEDFRPIFGCPPKNYSMLIFDRWGNLVFETKDVYKGWDGTIKGSPAPMDIYVWQISFSFYEGDKKRESIGHVTLLR